MKQKRVDEICKALDEFNEKLPEEFQQHSPEGPGHFYWEELEHKLFTIIGKIEDEAKE